MYRSRIWSNSLMYVAGFERGVRPIGDWSMSITLSSCSSPSIRSCAPGSAIAPFRSRPGRSRRMSPTSELLPEPETPVTQTNRPSGKRDVDVLEVVLPRAVDRERLGRPATLRSSGIAIALLAREIAARSGSAGDWARSAIVPCGDDLAPLDAGPRAEVDEVVGRAHRVLVVLDDDHRVARVAQPLQGRQQPVVVARVQADRRLVEDIEHAHQPRADLAGQADPLRLAAGERRRRAVERQVMQADVQSET